MKAAYLTGNAIDLLQNGSEFFPALIAAIDAAEREFHLETYIFEDDATGRAVAGALCRAARRGVAVRVLADGFGAADFVATLRPQLEAAGVQVLVYRPEIARFRLRRHRLRRLHRKLAVADGRSAFVGGINIVDDIDAAHPAPPRFDYAVRVEGPLLVPIHTTVRRLWTLVSWASFRQVLLAAAARGVQVTILLQGRIEYALQHYATQSLYDMLLGAGVRIFEYHHSYLHAKVGVIDCCWATVGSSNIDPFSLLLAREANVFVDDREFATRLHASLETAMRDGARELRREDWERKPWLQRLASRLAYGLVRLMIGIAGYGGKH